MPCHDNDDDVSRIMMSIDDDAMPMMLIPSPRQSWPYFVHIWPI